MTVDRTKLDRITKSSITERIHNVEFRQVEVNGTIFTYCYIIMLNGFKVTGDPSTSMNPNDFNEVRGREEAYAKTFNKLWELESYRRMEDLRVQTPFEDLQPPFSGYVTKTKTKIAVQIKEGDVIKQESPGSTNWQFYRAEHAICFTATATATVVVGDFIVFQNHNDIYHCPYSVMKENVYLPEE